MVTIVAPQPHSMGSASVASAVGGVSSFTLDQESSTSKFALVTPNVTPREANNSSPVPSLKMPQSRALPIAIANAALVSAPTSQSLLGSEGE